MKNIIILILFFISFNGYSQKTIITEFKLKNGYTVRGNIIDSIPNISYTIKTLKGIEQVYTIEEIETISKITIGKDKFDYIPKGKFSTNIDLGLQNFSNKESNQYAEYRSKGSGKLFGVSVNYNLFKNIEISLSYSFSNSNFEKNINFNNGSLYNYYTKINFDVNQYSACLAKYFTGYKIKPFLSLNIFYNMTETNGNNYDVNKVDGSAEARGFYSDDYNYFGLKPGVGIVYFINRNLSVSSSYNQMFDISNPNPNPYRSEILVHGFFVFSLKYTFRKNDLFCPFY